MIESIEIENFRCFKRLHVKNCAPINIVVGDNGSGKTTLLEAIFLALCSTPQRALLLRQWRGANARFSGQPDTIVESLFAEFFHDMSFDKQAEIRLGGSGPEVRSLTIVSKPSNVRITQSDTVSAGEDPTVPQTEVVAPIEFEWTDSKGHKRKAKTKIVQGGIEFETTGEKVPNFYFYAAQSPIPGQESAARFSKLRQVKKDRTFVKIFSEAFDWVEDISVEVSGGNPQLFASVKGSNVLLPLTAVSGAVNRMMAILTAVADRQKGIVFIDEIENGIFFSKHVACARALINLAREYECQLFLTSHSQEWLNAFIRAAGSDVSDIALWRIERAADGEGPEVSQFSGRTFKAGVDHGTEIRGEST